MRLLSKKKFTRYFHLNAREYPFNGAAVRWLQSVGHPLFSITCDPYISLEWRVNTIHQMTVTVTWQKIQKSCLQVLVWVSPKKRAYGRAQSKEKLGLPSMTLNEHGGGRDWTLPCLWMPLWHCRLITQTQQAKVPVSWKKRISRKTFPYVVI